MILLSRIIKSSLANHLEKKTIALKKLNHDQGFVDNDKSEEEILNEDIVQSIDEQLQKARLEADEIRDLANREWEQFQQRINTETQANQKRAEEMFKKAEESGYNEGFQKGLQEGQKQYEAFIQEARDIVAASKNDYYQRLEEAEPVIVRLAMKVAGKIISANLNNDSEHWLAVVKDVINEIREQDQVKLYIHPNWYEVTLSHKEELSLLLPNCEQLYIYPDVHLEENGCVIETPYGRIDASVDSQLLEVKQALLEKLKEFGGHEGN